MLTTIWTASLICLLALFLGAWFVVFCWDHGVHPFRDFVQFLKRQSIPARFLWVLFFTVTWVVASSKQTGGTDSGGTNTTQMTGSPLGAPRMTSGLNASFSSVVSTNTTRQLTAADFDRGFVLTQVGTNEWFDFSVPSQATVCADWRKFGAANDWFYHTSTNWSFRIGTNDIERMRIFSLGRVEPLVRLADGGVATNVWFAPLEGDLGIVPEANWGRLTNALESCFWYCLSPSNTLQLTWYNALLNRATEMPVSFQAEFGQSGSILFRYDFSRLETATVSNILAGASLNGERWATNSLPVNVTSLRFQPLSSEDATNTDPDDDGIPTIDELFVYRTDPHAADTDLDGLSDYDEIFVHHTDPLNPHSVSESLCDGFAVKIGDLDPFSCPEGSTNTVFEHVFYTGTTNTPFAYPQADAESAILRVAFSGTGSGELIVGEQVVPLLGVAADDLNSEGEGEKSPVVITNTLLIAVEKGVRKTLWFRKSDWLDMAIGSEDFCIGETPLFPFRRGWIAFPHTDATIPCIHDFNGGGKTVSLVHGEEFAGLTATWSSDGDGVVITNVAPVSAQVYGNFSKDQTRSISYTVDHPKRLDGMATFTQTLRFCPQIEDDDTSGFSGDVGDDEESWYDEEHDSFNTNFLPLISIDDEEDEESFSNIVYGTAQQLSNVLYLHRANTRSVHLEVPGGTPANCCPCPEHRNRNYVEKSSSSSRVKVLGPDGDPFSIAYESCDVTVHGVSPSRTFNDASVHYVTNGASYKRTSYTVLGVDIERPGGTTPIERFNQLSPSLGFPLEICTNLADAVSLVLRTDVLLTNGVVRLALEDVSGDFELWLPYWWDRHGAFHDAEKLLDSATRHECHYAIQKWRSLMNRYRETRELEVKVLSSAAGSCRIRYEYASSDGAYYVHDSAQQTVTSVAPVLLADSDRDGVIGAGDVSRHLDGRYTYFWRNDDCWKGDNAFDTSLTGSVNSSDDVVNGRNDLINFLPIAVDVKSLRSHWGESNVYFRIESESSALRRAKLAFADIDRSQIGDAPLGEASDIAGNDLHQTPVAGLEDGTNLPPAFVSLSSQDRSTLFVEFPECARYGQRLYLNAYAQSDDAPLFSSSIRLHVGDVAHMIGWENLRGAAGGSGGVSTDLTTYDWPEDEHGQGNVVFVHGYNMAEDAETPLWAKNVFKKLWWAGLDRGFIAVQWRGNEGQADIPLVGYLTPNYYGNVQNAFLTASALATAMSGIQGPKWFLAHSLGNMLVSAAIQDYGMAHEKYFLLNAAVALEAFDPVNGVTTQSHDDMTPSTWVDYVDKVRATHWFERFPENDGRRLLTWKGRFANVTNIVNFYSTEEEVVNNGDGGTHSLTERNYVWYNQETRKGLWPMMLHEYEGGWDFNPYYDTVVPSLLGPEHEPQRIRMTPQNAALLTDEQLQQAPFFLDFANPLMHSSSNGVFVATNYLYRAEMLAYAIPSESYAAGANPMPSLTAYTNAITAEVVSSRNHNMAMYISGQDELPENGAKPENKHRDWQHSTFVQRSYKRTCQLFRKITQIVEGKGE